MNPTAEHTARLSCPLTERPGREGVAQVGCVTRSEKLRFKPNGNFIEAKTFKPRPPDRRTHRAFELSAH